MECAGTGDNDFDDNALFETTSAETQGTLSLSGNRVSGGTASDLNGQLLLYQVLPVTILVKQKD